MANFNSKNILLLGLKGEPGTSVTANPTLAGTEDNLTGLQVGNTKYKVASGGGGWSSVVDVQTETSTDNPFVASEDGILAMLVGASDANAVIKIFEQQSGTSWHCIAMDSAIDNGIGTYRLSIVAPIIKDKSYYWTGAQSPFRIKAYYF